MKGTCEQLGATMMIAWILLVGPLGGVALLGAAFAIIAGNLALAVACVALLICPTLVLTGVWGLMTLAGIVGAHLAERPAEPLYRAARAETT